MTATEEWTQIAPDKRWRIRCDRTDASEGVSEPARTAVGMQKLRLELSSELQHIRSLVCARVKSIRFAP